MIFIAIFFVGVLIFISWICNDLEYKTKYVKLLENYTSLSIFLRNKTACMMELDYIEGFMKFRDIEVSDSLFRQSISFINKYLLSIDEDDESLELKNKLLDNLKFIDDYYK